MKPRAIWGLDVMHLCCCLHYLATGKTEPKLWRGRSGWPVHGLHFRSRQGTKRVRLWNLSLQAGYSRGRYCLPAGNTDGFQLLVTWYAGLVEIECMYKFCTVCHYYQTLSKTLESYITRIQQNVDSIDWHLIDNISYLVFRICLTTDTRALSRALNLTRLSPVCRC